MLGYTGGFLGPLAIGWIRHLAGGMSPTAWRLALLHMAVVVAIGELRFVSLRPRDLAGNRPAPGGGRRR